MLLRRVARPLLAGIFVSSGLDTLLNPGPKVDKAAPLLKKAGEALPIEDPPPPATLVQLDAAVKVAAGSLLAAGYAPRLASAALAASLVPTTVIAHPFWQEHDDTARTAQRVHFFKNLAMLGGLLLAAADTQGRPSLGWWARRAVRRANSAVLDAAHTVGDTASGVADRAENVAHRATDIAHRAGDRATDVAHRAADVTGDAAHRVRAAVR
ncbi:MAG TPA: DoxX family protein [Pseudonocardiaceae bacterium]